MKHWFSQLAPREYRTLIIGIVSLGIIMGYFMLWEPLVIARLQLENVVAAQKNTLHWMNHAAAEVLQLRQQSIKEHGKYVCVLKPLALQN